ncbi:MAG TPA: NAD(P)/FAD-dependent oxidoreductase [Gemmatimonadales bacterium]|nr:NAD(P)/FAD-dependent oxidoreductase [Gemmatimonadales bacterium]
MTPRYDCIVVGGGPAGLSAALVLGRARRSVLVCDTGRPRNRWARQVNAYLTRDGISPEEFLEIARREAAGYPTVTIRQAEVEDADATPDGFEVRLAGGERCGARTLLIATGMVDELPAIEGLGPLYGTSVHHCPYCDGWEHRDQVIAVYGHGPKAAGFALTMTQWSRDVVWCSDGPCGLGDRARVRLDAFGVGVREERVVRLEGRDGQLERVVFHAGPPLECQALFFSTGQRQGSRLVERLGVPVTARGTVNTGKAERTEVPGLYVAGDASKDAQLVIVAAAEGAEAAIAINTALCRAQLPVDVVAAT